jgi:hypothetical protein
VNFRYVSFKSRGATVAMRAEAKRPEISASAKTGCYLEFLILTVKSSASYVFLAIKLIM